MLPIITYGFPLWRPSADNLKRLRSVLTRPLARVLAPGKSVHFDSVLVEYGLPSISDIRRRHVIAFARRTIKLPPHHHTRMLFNAEYRAATADRENDKKRAPRAVGGGIIGREVLQVECDWNVEFDADHLSNTALNDTAVRVL